MATLFSIGFIVLGVVFFCVGLTGPVCPVHGDESFEFMTAGVVGIATGTAIAFIGIIFGKNEKTVEVERRVDEHYNKAKQELDEKENNKFFYDTLMEDDELYEQCMKNWQVHIKTPVKDAFGNITYIPDSVIEDVMSEREIVFPERFGTVVKGLPS